MSVKRSGDAAQASTSVRPPAPPSDHLDSAIDAARGTEPAARYDAIALSERAKAALQASTVASACLFSSMLAVCATVEISAETSLTLESGVYRLVRR